MYFPKTAEYALRAMAHMARLPNGHAARAQELARAADIPTPYLSKILRKLVLGGLLKSKKGHGGGFVLARPPRLIRFLDVLTASTFESNPVACAFGWGDCDPHHPCPLHPAWSSLRNSFVDWAASQTLADVKDAPLLPRELAALGLDMGAQDRRPRAVKGRPAAKPTKRRPSARAARTRARG